MRANKIVYVDKLVKKKVLESQRPRESFNTTLRRLLGMKVWVKKMGRPPKLKEGE